MMRIVRVVPTLLSTLLATALSAAAARAQTPAAAPAASKVHAEFNVGATFGHKSDASIGGEAGIRLMPNLDVFVEGGHIGNAASTDLDRRATTIANNVGAAASAISKVNYFDAGIRYHWPLTPSVDPYIAFGVGAAQVKNETALSVSGTVVAPETLGVQFGTDLNGTEKKPFVMFGGGATVALAQRYFLDLTYRYGAVLAKTSVTENDVAIKTQRAQVGIGVRF